MMKLLLIAVLVTCVICVEGKNPLGLNKAIKTDMKQLDFVKRDLDVCFQYTCATGRCGTNMETNPPSFAFCTTGFCNSTLEVCTPKLPLGSVCDDSDECQSDHCTESLPDGRRCVNYVPPKENGEVCTSNPDCVSGICNNTVCVGAALGETCFNGGDYCGTGMFCNITNPLYNTGVCALYLTAGAACQYYNSHGCPAGTYCGLNNNDQWNCSSSFTTVIGSTCADNSNCPDLSYCDDSGDLGYGICKNAPGASSKAPCTGTCQSPNEQCLCSPATGTTQCVNTLFYTNPAGNRAAAKALMDCAVAKCNSTIDTSCMEDNCKAELCAYTALNIPATVAYYEFYYPKCYLDIFIPTITQDGCGAPTPAPAGSVIAVTIVVSGTCGDSNANAIITALKNTFSVKGDVACVSVSDNNNNKRNTVAQYTASLNTPITVEQATISLAVVSNQVTAQGVTVLSTANTQQAATTNAANSVVFGFVSLVAVVLFAVLL